MINFKKETKQKELGMCKPVAYFKASSRRQHFVMEMLPLWGLHCHLVFNKLFHILPSIVQLSSLKKPGNSLNKKTKRRRRKEQKKKEDDRDRYRVSFMETASPRGAHVIRDLWYCTGW